jgi:hypothetical protein
MNDHELERLAKQLGRAGDRVDPEATARAVLDRLKAESEQEPSVRAPAWTRRPLVRVAAAAALVAATVLGVEQLRGPATPTDAELPVAVSLSELAADELNSVLDSLDYEAPVHELVPVALADLNEDELTALLESLEG